MRRNDYKGVYLPHALAGKYPNAPKEFNWHYLFPSSQLSIEPGTKNLRRHHIHETNIQKAVKSSARSLDFKKQVTCHTLRHSFATHFCNEAPIFEPFKSNWGTRTCEQLKYIHMYYRLEQIVSEVLYLT